MFDDIKPAMLNEGDAQVPRTNNSEEDLPADIDSIEGVTGAEGDTSQVDGNPLRDIRREDVEGGHTRNVPSDIEAGTDGEGEG